MYTLFSEHVSVAIKREFIEEAMNSNPEGAKYVDELFKTAVPVIKLVINYNLYRIEFL